MPPKRRRKTEAKEQPEKGDPNIWREAVRNLYPYLLCLTYFLPAVYFNRVPLEDKTVAGKPVKVYAQPAGRDSGAGTPSASTSQPTSQQASQPKVRDCDVREDFAQQHVLHCIRELADTNKETMFVLSQVDYKLYLAVTQPSSAPASGKPTDRSKGDFDIVFIHRKFGILLGEIKSVGLVAASLNKDAASASADLRERVCKAIDQLDKSEQLMKLIVDDVKAGLLVRKTLILPYVTQMQLQLVLDSDPDLGKALRRCLGAQDAGAAAHELCLCSDQMSDRACPWNVTSANRLELGAWWHRRMACAVDTNMSDDVYLECVSRVVGPPCTVTKYWAVPPRVRTEGEGVSEVGRMMIQIVLTENQVTLVNSTERMVCLTGPPGTGKTVVLELKGLDWLRQGHDVHVVSWYRGTLAVSTMLHDDLQKTLTLADKPTATQPGTAHFHQYELGGDDVSDSDVDAAVGQLTTLVNDGQLYVLMDEVKFTYGAPAERMRRFVTALSDRVPELFLWTASLCSPGIPDCLQQKELTDPLRFPPAVCRKIRDILPPGMPKYETYAPLHEARVVVASDGPEVIRVGHGGQGHSGTWPVECVGCGRELGKILARLRVGEAAHGSDSASESPPHLLHKDVLVLTRSPELRDEITDDATGKMTSPACGFVHGLRSLGVKVRVLDWSGADLAAVQKEVADVALAEDDHVTVTDITAVHGLERKIVVYLEGRRRSAVPDVPDELTDNMDKVRAFSRCTSQLILVVRTPQASSSIA